MEVSTIAGRVGRNLVDVGNLIGEGEPTLLATVTRYDPLELYRRSNHLRSARTTDVST